MPRVSNGDKGAFAFRVTVTDVEHRALFRDLLRISTGAKRKARLFALAHMGLALEISGSGQLDSRANRAAEREEEAVDGPLTNLSRSDLADILGDTSTHSEEQGA